MERSLKLTIEQAQKLYKEQPEMRELLLTTFTKEELEGIVLKDWRELEDITGYWITPTSVIILNINKLGGVEINRNIFATEKQAKSALAMAQLSQLMQDLGDECDIDWTVGVTPKHVIQRYKNSLIPYCSQIAYSFLAFKTPEIRNAFMTKHERLIKDYFMLD